MEYKAITSTEIFVNNNLVGFPPDLGHHKLSHSCDQKEIGKLPVLALDLPSLGRALSPDRSSLNPIIIICTYKVK